MRNDHDNHETIEGGEPSRAMANKSPLARAFRELRLIIDGASIGPDDDGARTRLVREASGELLRLRKENVALRKRIAEASATSARQTD
jgi:hypothetical protein